MERQDLGPSETSTGKMPSDAVGGDQDLESQDDEVRMVDFSPDDDDHAEAALVGLEGHINSDHDVTIAYGSDCAEGGEDAGYEPIIDIRSDHEDTLAYAAEDISDLGIGAVAGVQADGNEGDDLPLRVNFDAGETGTLPEGKKKSPAGKRTRYGRTINRPARYEDFVGAW